MCDDPDEESERNSESDVDSDVDIEKVCRITVVCWTLNAGYYISLLLFTGCRDSV